MNYFGLAWQQSEAEWLVGAEAGETEWTTELLTPFVFVRDSCTAYFIHLVAIIEFGINTSHRLNSISSAARTVLSPWAQFSANAARYPGSSSSGLICSLGRSPRCGESRWWGRWKSPARGPRCDRLGILPRTSCRPTGRKFRCHGTIPA